MFPRYVFQIAGWLGLMQIVPLFFLENYVNSRMPPPMNQPIWFYGFLGVCLPWQLAFILIGRHPERYRPLMPLAVIEKLSFVTAMAVLLVQGRVPAELLPGPALDAVWAALFVTAWVKTKGA